MFNRKTQVMMAVLVLGVLAGAVGAVGQLPGLGTSTQIVIPSSEYRFLGEAEGWLSGDGNFDIYEQTLTGGRRYKFTLTGPWSADFDILIFDENENLVAKSVGVTSEEVVYITPLWRGPFYIAVVSYDGRGSYVLRLYREI